MSKKKLPCSVAFRDSLPTDLYVLILTILMQQHLPCLLQLNTYQSVKSKLEVGQKQKGQRDI